MCDSLIYGHYTYRMWEQMSVLKGFKQTGQRIAGRFFSHIQEGLDLWVIGNSGTLPVGKKNI